MHWEGRGREGREGEGRGREGKIGGVMFSHFTWGGGVRRHWLMNHLFVIFAVLDVSFAVN